MRITRSCFYAYRKRKSAAAQVQRQVPNERVKKCFYFHRRRYGSRRIAAELQLGRFRVQTMMRAEGLRAITPLAFKPRTTDSRHDARISPNLLKNSDAAPQFAVGHDLRATSG